MSQTDANSQADNEPVTRVALSIFLILAGSFFSPVLIHSSTIAIPQLSAELGLTATQASWYTLLTVLGNLFLVIPAGKMGDIYGRRRIFSLGLAISASGCLVAGFSYDPALTLAARLVMGMGMAFIWSNALALITTIPKPSQRARVMGFYTAIAYMGMVSGPILGGFIVEHMAWRFVFHIPGTILMGLALLGFFGLNWEHYGDRSMRLGFTDTTIYLIAIAVFGSASFVTNNAIQVGLVVSGLALLLLFGASQTKRKDPLIQVKLFTESLPFTTLAVTHMATYFCLFAIPFTFTVYLTYVKGLGAQTVGWIIMVQALATVVVSSMTGSFNRALGERNLMIVGAILVALMVISIALIQADSPLYMSVLVLAALGAGVGLLDPTLFHRALSMAPPAYLGGASSLMTGLRTLGSVSGMTLISTLIARRLPGVEINASHQQELMTVFKEFYLISGGTLCCAMLFLIVILIRRHPNNRSNQD